MKTYCITIAILFLICSHRLISQDNSAPKLSSTPTKIQTNDQYDFISVNNVLMWLANNGNMCYNPTKLGNGFIWPKESGLSLIFEDGLVWGGSTNGKVYAGGSTYRQGLQAGKILPNIEAADPTDPGYRIYKVRKVDAIDYALMSETERERLKKDFIDWPVNDGARFIDSNHNGRYDPDFNLWLSDSTRSDKPWFIGDEVLWFVMNDLDSARTRNLYGSEPFGVEIQTMLWAYSRPGVLNNTVFVKHTLINKGWYDFERMYLGLWVDPDLGDAGDDFVGIDTLLQIAYAYNGLPRDDVYGIPPAMGNILLQGPTVHDANSFGTVNFEKRRWLRNLPFTSFILFGPGGDVVYSDPPLGIYQGTTALFNNLQGFLWNGTPFIDPTNNIVTKYALAGDPISRTGWIDGIIHAPYDRRYMACIGPFIFNRGDTQEVIYAKSATIGHGRLESVIELKKAARSLHSLARSNYDLSSIPTHTIDVSYPNTSSARILLSVTANNASSIEGVVRSRDGKDIARFQLYDDGQHGDSLAGDFHFAGEWETTRQREGVDCYFVVDKGSERENEWFAGECLPLSGIVQVTLDNVESDHLNYDNVANPGENIRISVRMENKTSFTIGPLEIWSQGFAPGTPELIVFRDSINVSSSSLLPYDPKNPSTYFSFDVPSNAIHDQRFLLPVSVRDSYNNRWYDSLMLTVKEYVTPPVDSLAIHVAGDGYGLLGWRVSDYTALRDHTYRITVQGSDDEDKSVSIHNLNTQQTLLARYPLPDIYAHNMPSIEGWRLNLGTVFHTRVIPDESVYGSVVSSYFPQERLWLNAIVNWELGQLFFGSKLGIFDAVPIKLVFDRNGQKAYNYLRGGNPNYGYQGYYDVSIRAYDISDSLNPRQVNLAFVEQIGSSQHNHYWDPAFLGDREYLFVFNSSYQETPDPFYTSKRILADAGAMDILYSGWFYKKISSSTFVDGDYFLILPKIPISTRDTFLVNPLGMVNGVSNEFVPHRVNLSAHPNPIVSESMISFTLSEHGFTSLRLVDILGRPIATLVSSSLDPGQYNVVLSAEALPSSGTFYAILTFKNIKSFIAIQALK